MKRKFLSCLILFFLITLTACEPNKTNGDTAKIQESIEKIKTKIQENFPVEESNAKENKEKQKDKPTD